MARRNIAIGSYMVAELKEAKPAATGQIQSRSGIVSPYFDLDSSLRVAEVIHNKGGGACSSDQLAAWLGYKSTRSGTYLTRVSAANKHFGLVEQHGDRLTVTERAQKILAPVMPEDADNEKIEAFLAVPLFAKIYDQFRGKQLPPEVGLRNLFQSTYKIVPDRVPQSVRIFLDSAEQAGFFSATGDRSRLIRPSLHSVNATPQAPAQSEEFPEAEKPLAPEKPKHSSGGDGTTGGVHSAIVGLLRELPSPGSQWSSQKKQRFLDAFKATIDFIYPEVGEG